MEMLYADVYVDTPHPHLDRPFTYSIPEPLQAIAFPGVRVRVKFAGRKVDGYLYKFVETAERPEKVLPVLEILGPPVISENQFELATLVATRYVGATYSVLDSIAPSRQVRAEAKLLSQIPAPHEIPEKIAANYSEYSGLNEFFENLSKKNKKSETPPQIAPMRAALCVMPKTNQYELLAIALINTAVGGKGALAVVPDYRDLELLARALDSLGSANQYLQLHAGLSAATRYTNYLRILRDEVRIVIGTRNSAFAPVPNLATIVLLDDSDDALADSQAPYWHAREVVAMRAQAENLNLLSVSITRSPEVQLWVESGWAKDLAVDRTIFRKSGPIIRGTTDQDLARDPLARHARIPGAAFTALKTGIAKGPVLISVPRRGYQLHLQCQQCRTPARCLICEGALHRATQIAIPACMRCGNSAGDWECVRCHEKQLRSAIVGAARTAEEIGRAFPGVRIITSGKDQIVAEISNEPALVIATPGAEPLVIGGKYQAAVILDPELSLGRADLRAEEESFFRWMRVFALVEAGGAGVITMPDTYEISQLLIKFDPVGFAERELKSRHEAQLTPSFSTFEIFLPSGVWASEKAPAPARILGPVPISAEESRILVTCARSDATQIALWLKGLVAKHSSSKKPGQMRVRRDPIPLR